MVFTSSCLDVFFNFNFLMPVLLADSFHGRGFVVRSHGTEYKAGALVQFLRGKALLVDLRRL